MFRPVAFSVRGPDSLQIGFNKPPSDQLTVDNFQILSNFSNEPSLTIKSLEVTGSVVTIFYSISAPLVSYTLVMRDTPFQKFESSDGDSLQIDGSDNKFIFIGPEGPSDIRDNMIDYLSAVYSGSEDNLLHKHISNLAEQMSRARSTIRQKSNSVYLEEIVPDSLIERGSTYADRLPQESAYQIDRVSTKVTADSATEIVFEFNSDNTSLFSSFPAYANPALNSFPVGPYQARQVITKEIVSNAERLQNSFSGLSISLENGPITQILSIVLRQGGVNYPYDITTYPVGLADNKYDSQFCYKNFSLKPNQIILDPAAVYSGSIPEPTPLDEWFITYAYDDLSRKPLSGTFEIFEVLQSVREQTPAVSNVFSLKNFPITDDKGNELTIDGVSFLNPLSTVYGAPYTQPHPAFITEVPFDRLSPPAKPGEFSVDYKTGQVLVYGATSVGTGTGSVPPVATYLYKKEYVENIDFVFDSELSEVVAVSGRGLDGRQALIRFKYDNIFIPGIDYIAEVHNESLGEYIENRFTGVNRITTLNAPITDVFRVFNETTGESYGISYFDRNQIRISGNQLPRREQILSEAVDFVSVLGEELFIATTVSVLGSEAIYSINLSASPIMAESQPLIGSAKNSSFVPDSDYLIRQFYYDEVYMSLNDNLTKLLVVGDYLVNHSLGIIYFRAPINIDFYIGTANFRHGLIRTANDQIMSVDHLRYSATASSEPLLSIDHSRFTSDFIYPSTLISTTERFLGKSSDNVILFGSVQWGNFGNWQYGTNIFNAVDAEFTEDMADGYHILRFVGDVDRQIVSYISPTRVQVDIPFLSQEANVPWTLLNNSTDSGFCTVTTYEARDVRGVYLVNDLQTMPADAVVNYWDRSVDKIEGNRIIFNNPLAKTSGLFGQALAIDYGFGSLYLDYEYLTDRIRIDYEWGDNQIRWLRPPSEGTEYYCTFRYGALRRELADNFISLTGLPELVGADLEMDREIIRDLTRATIQVFSRGPTLASMETLARIPTGINPTVRELSFNEWTLGRDNLYPVPPLIVGNPTYSPCRWGLGLDTSSCYLELPGERAISYRSGSFFCKIKPLWNGINNNGIITAFADCSPDEIWLGASGVHPDSNQFELKSNDYHLIGRPVQLGTRIGLFCWFDTESNSWQFAFIGTHGSSLDVELRTDGLFSEVVDGYIDGNLDLEITDTKTTTSNYLVLNFNIDDEDSSGVQFADSYIDELGIENFEAIYSDSVKLVASKSNYIFDTGLEDRSRLSLLRDESGYLVLRVIDSGGNHRWQLSTDITSWLSGEVHSIGASWKINGAEGQDELHLFIDGQEVPNINRWSHPIQTNIFRTIAQQVLPPPASPIVSAEDGKTVSGSPVLVCNSIDFISLGITAGDSLSILENNADGVGGPYTIISVLSNSLTLDSALTLTLSNVRFSLNSQIWTLDTNIEGVFSLTVNGNELAGPNAQIPQYAVSRSAGNYAITVYDGINPGDSVIVRTLGLSMSRSKTLVCKLGEALSTDSYMLSEDGEILTQEDGGFILL